ncbi:site-specific integrase [Microbacterium aurantiacum]
MSGRKHKTNRASFGSTRKLPSGRWQARYPDPAGRAMTAPSTFATKREALDHLAGVRADRMRGTYRDHRAGLTPFGEYAREWIANGGTRGQFAPKTKANNEALLAGLLLPFHDQALSAISPSDVRTWYTRARKNLHDAGRKRAAAAHKRALEVAARRGDAPPPAPAAQTGESRLRQGYTLLRSILATAVRDGLIGSNPCQIAGAGSVAHPERPLLNAEMLDTIVSTMPEQWTLPIRVMFGAHLRLGELVALQRGDYADGVLKVERQTTLVDGKPITTKTKTGNARTVALPPTIAAKVEAHLGASRAFPRSPMFLRADGEPITNHALGQAWRRAARKVGLGQFHVHDVRHAGLTMAAQAGATTRELMARAGHRTARASLIYQHAAEERGITIAAALDVLNNPVLAGKEPVAITGNP